MGFLGSTRGATPGSMHFAKRSVVFERAYAQAPVTTVIARHHPVRNVSAVFIPVSNFGSPLPDRIPYLSEILRSHGYRTGAFVGSLVLDPRSGTAPGFDRGFDRYDAGFRLRRAGENRYGTLERRGRRCCGAGNCNGSARPIRSPGSRGCTCSTRTIPTIRRPI
jgi:arylsulfatase A-like enzyme